MIFPDNKDYPIFAEGIGDFKNFEIRLNKDPKDIDYGDRILIYHWKHLADYRYLIVVGNKIPQGGGYRRAKLTFDNPKGEKTVETQVKFEEGVLHTKLPNIREISLLAIQNISIRYSFRSYNKYIQRELERSRKIKDYEKAEKEKREKYWNSPEGKHILKLFNDEQEQLKKDKLEKKREAWSWFNRSFLLYLDAIKIWDAKKEPFIDEILELKKQRRNLGGEDKKKQKELFEKTNNLRRALRKEQNDFMSKYQWPRTIWGNLKYCPPELEQEIRTYVNKHNIPIRPQVDIDS